MGEVILAMATAGILANLFYDPTPGKPKPALPNPQTTPSDSSTAVVKYMDEKKVVELSTPWFDPHSFKWTTLVGGTFGGALTVGLIPGARVVGATLLVTSMYAAYKQGIVKEVGIATLAITNPVALGNLAFTATKETVSEAIKLSGTVIGLIVTGSGAVIGYVLLNKK